MRMLHPAGSGTPRPVDVPIIIGALGPKGAAVARELGDGLYITLALPEFAKEFSRVSYLFWGTIRDDGEDPGSERVRAAGGPGWALAYHGAYEFGMPLEDLPGGAEWKAVVERTAPEERHLAVHDQHMVGLNTADQAAWDAGADTMVEAFSFTGTAATLRARAAKLADKGVTEIVYQPAGPDIRRELQTFIEAVSV